MEWLRDRSIRVAAGIAIAVAIPGAVLFYFQFRSLSDLGRSSAVVLQQLSRETNDRVTTSVTDTLKSPYFNTLVRISQPQLEPLDLPFIESTFQSSHDAFADRFYVWSELTDAHKGEVLAFDRGQSGIAVNPPEAQLLLERFHALASEKKPIAWFEDSIDGRQTYFQAVLRFTAPARERLTSFAAVRIDGDRLRRTFLPQLVAHDLETVGGPSGFPALDVTVLDSTGRVVFPSNRTTAPAQFVDEGTFPFLFFDDELLPLAASDRPAETWRVLTGYGDRTIPEIISARERPQRAMMAVLAAVMAIGVFFVASAAAREVRVAELKSSFVASVSHDLKTPLALIQLFAETLELGRLKHTDRAQEYYRIINSEARKLTRLIDNMLDFSRIEAGLRRYRREPEDLVGLVHRVVDALDSQFRHNRFTVTVQTGGAAIPVLIDQAAARQAIENLLSNAMKYSPDHGDIHVVVDAADGFGRVRVTDTGIGIAPRQQRRIFRKFYRVQTDAASGPQGTGLGLAIVDHVMRGHGGFVRVESEPGRGSSFTLHFPQYPENFTVTKRILVVEDEPQMLLGLRDNLELEGYEVLTAVDGDEGLEKAISAAPDLVLLDVTLPCKNGFDVCRELRARESPAAVLMLTARAQETDKVRGLEIGADDYVTKPFSITELLARVKAVLRRSGGRPAPLEKYRIGDVDLNFRTHQAHRAGRRLDFTAREFNLLRYFVAHAGQVVTRDQILNEVWGYEESPTTRTIDNFVAKLRQKLEASPREPEHILTVHGSGYKFVG